MNGNLQIYCWKTFFYKQIWFVAVHTFICLPGNLAAFIKIWPVLLADDLRLTAGSSLWGLSEVIPWPIQTGVAVECRTHMLCIFYPVRILILCCKKRSRSGNRSLVWKVFPSSNLRELLKPTTVNDWKRERLCMSKCRKYLFKLPVIHFLPTLPWKSFSVLLWSFSSLEGLSCASLLPGQALSRCIEAE